MGEGIKIYLEHRIETLLHVLTAPEAPFSKGQHFGDYFSLHTNNRNLDSFVGCNLLQEKGQVSTSPDYVFDFKIGCTLLYLGKVNKENLTPKVEEGFREIVKYLYDKGINFCTMFIDRQNKMHYVIGHSASNPLVESLTRGMQEKFPIISRRLVCEK